MSIASEERELHYISRLLVDLYSIDATYRQGTDFVLSLTSQIDPERAAAILDDRLRLAGYFFDIKTRTGQPTLLNIEPKRRLKIPPLNIILFFVTLATMYLVPVFFSSRPGEFLSNLRRGDGLEFTAAMMSILLVHEMGHFVAGRRRGIVTSWPYFLPAPNLIGTFGAIIRSRSPFWNRRDLIEVGAAGPIAGFVVALFWLVYGLPHSTLTAVSPDGAMSLGDSVLMNLLCTWLLPTPPAGFDYLLSEGAFAGWVGLLVTAINLLPVGQLDGGHIVYALFHRHQRRFGWIAWFALVAMGFLWPGWWIFAAFGLAFGVTHPPTLDDQQPLGRTAVILGIVALIIFVVSLTPAPFPF
jgi:hypothetical protein